MRLHPSAAAAGIRLVALDTVGSTNAEALARGRGGDPGPLWICAARQTHGRGRRGRIWISGPGNLHASLLLAEPSPPGKAAELSFVCAVALHDALLGLAPALHGRLVLKWPNDLLLDGAKVAGILLEAESLPGGRFISVAGFGVNCACHPADLAGRATDLAAAGLDIGPAALLAQLSAALPLRLQQWDRGRGFAAIRRDWLARAGGVGEPIRVRTAGNEMEGIFTALDPAGRLVLTLPDGSMHSIAAAEVFPPTRSRPRVSP